MLRVATSLTGAEASLAWDPDLDRQGLTRGFEPETVYIRPDLAPDVAARTVAHEVKHCQQFQEGRVDTVLARGGEIEQAEREARAFEEEAMREYRSEPDSVLAQELRALTRTL